MPSPPSPNNPLQLISLDPYELLKEFIPPYIQALHPKLKRTRRHPKENDPVVRYLLEGQLPHLHVLHGSVWQGHVDVPGWICHYDVHLAQDGEVELSDVAI